MWQQKASDDALTEYFYIEHHLLDASADGDDWPALVPNFAFCPKTSPRMFYKVLHL